MADDFTQLAPEVVNAQSGGNPIADALRAVGSLVTPNANDADKIAAISRIAAQKGMDPAALLAMQQKAEAANPMVGAPAQPFTDPNTVLPPTPVLPNAQSPAQQNEMNLQASQSAGNYLNNAGGPMDIQAMQNRSVNTLAQQPQLVSQSSMAPEAPAADASKFVTPTATPTVPQKVGASAEDQGMKELNSAYNMQRQGIAAAADVGAKKAAEFMGANQQIADEMGKRQNELVEKQRKIEDETNGELEKLKNIQYDIANSKIDPDHYYKDSGGNEDTGKKIMSGLAIALGGIGGTLTGKGGNVGLDLVQKAIDRDIDAQKFNIQNKKDSAVVQNSVLSQMQRKFDNANQAEAATRAIYIDQAKAKLASLASKYEGPEIQAKAQQLMGQLDEEKAKTLYAFRSASEQKAASKQFGATITNRVLTPDEINSIQDEKVRNRIVPGYAGLAVDKERAAEFSKYRNETEPAINAFGRVIDLTKNYNKFTDFNTTKAIKTELAGLLGGLRIPLTGPGVLTDAEKEMIKDTIGDPTKILAYNPFERIKMQTIVNKMSADLNNQAKAAGLTPKNTVDLKTGKPVK